MRRILFAALTLTALCCLPTAEAQTVTNDAWKFSVTAPSGWRHVGLRLRPEYEEASDDVVFGPTDAASLQQRMFIVVVPRLVTSYQDAAGLMAREGASVGRYRPLTKLAVSQGEGSRIFVRSYVSTNQRPLRFRVCAVLSDGKEALYIEGGMIRGASSQTQKLLKAVNAVLQSYRGLGKTRRNVAVEGYIKGSWTYINGDASNGSIHGGVIAFDGQGRFRAASSGFAWTGGAPGTEERADPMRIHALIRQPGRYVVIGKTLVLNYKGTLVHYRLDYCNSGIWLNGQLFAR